MNQRQSLSTIQHLNEYIELLKPLVTEHFQGSVVRSKAPQLKNMLTAKEYDMLETVNQMSTHMLNQILTIEQMATNGIKLLCAKVDWMEQLI